MLGQSFKERLQCYLEGRARVLGWLGVMNSVIEYIEGHLSDEINMEKIASLSGYPAITFQRMFSIVCDFSLSEYIRRRRLTMAAFELLNSDEKIIDIAAKYEFRLRRGNIMNV